MLKNLINSLNILKQIDLLNNNIFSSKNNLSNFKVDNNFLNMLQI